MTDTTPLGFEKKVPGGLETYGTEAGNLELLDRLLTLFMGHRHDGSTDGPDLTAPGPPASVIEQAAAGKLPSGKVIFYRATVIDESGLESLGSPTAYVTTSPGVAPPALPAMEIDVLTSGGDLPAGIYQYAITAWVGSHMNETTPSASVPVHLLSENGDEQQVSINLPALPAGADGFNVYRRFPNSPMMLRIASLTGEQEDPYVDSDPGGDVSPPGIGLPTKNTSAYQRVVRVARPADVAPGTEWVVYRSIEDETEWRSSRVGSTTAAYLDDLGAPTTFHSPPEAVPTYLNPPPVRPDEITALPLAIVLRTAGPVTTGDALEWVSPSTVAVASAFAHVDVDHGATTGDIVLAIEQWDGSSWDSLAMLTIDEGIAEGTVDLETAALSAGTRLRARVTDDADGLSENLTIQLRVWIKGAGSGVWFPEIWTP